MRRSTLLFAALMASIFVFYSCRNENADGQLTLLAEGMNHGGKMLVDGYSTAWATGDTVRINYETVTVSVSDGSATVSSGSKFTAPFFGVYPAGIYGSNSGASYTLNLPATYSYAVADGKQNLASPMVAYAESGSTLMFKHLTAAIGVQVVNYHHDYAIVVDSITIISDKYRLGGSININVNGDISVSPIADAGANYVESQRYVKMTFDGGASLVIPAGDSAVVQLPVLPVGTDNKFTVRIGVHRADISSVSAVMTRTQSTGGELPRAFLGYARYTLGGPFSVSNSKKVVFSKGNLQYHALSNTWRFAEHQYDYIGQDNSYIAASYDGWIDLFGWGTGTNPTLVSTNVNDYSTFADWGMTAVDDIGSYWYTMKGDEWDYMLKTILANPGVNCRNTNSFNMPSPSATYSNSARYVKAIVESKTGLIIFPDCYVHPDGVSISSTITSYNDSYGYFNRFVITSGWDKMELAGAVFLSAAGERQGITINNVTTYGNYYASDYTGNAGYHCYFRDGSSMNSKASTYPTSNKSYGYSVRLVRDIN